MNDILVAVNLAEPPAAERPSVSPPPSASASASAASGSGGDEPTAGGSRDGSVAPSPLLPRFGSRSESPGGTAVRSSGSLRLSRDLAEEVAHKAGDDRSRSPGGTVIRAGALMRRDLAEEASIKAGDDRSRSPGGTVIRAGPQLRRDLAEEASIKAAMKAKAIAAAADADAVPPTASTAALTPLAQVGVAKVSPGQARKTGKAAVRATEMLTQALEDRRQWLSASERAASAEAAPSPLSRPGSSALSRPPSVPLRETIAKCLEEWEVNSDSSEDDDDFCGWRVGSRALTPPPARPRSSRPAHGAQTDRGGRPGVLDVGIVAADRAPPARKEVAPLGKREHQFARRPLEKPAGALRNCTIS